MATAWHAVHAVPVAGAVLIAGAVLAATVGFAWASVRLLAEGVGRLSDTITISAQPRPPRDWQQLLSASAGDLSALIAWDDPEVSEVLAQLSDRSPAGLSEWVGTNIRYLGDTLSLEATRDHWQTPAETLDRRTGDCEDQAILLVAMCRAAGVPADRTFVAVGSVEGGGHAWAVVRLDRGWVVYEPTGEGLKVLTRDGAKLLAIGAGGLELVSLLDAAAIEPGTALLAAIVGLWAVDEGGDILFDDLNELENALRSRSYTASFNDQYLTLQGQ